MATDEYHIAKLDPGLRVSRVEYNNTPQRDQQIVFNAKRSIVSGLVEDIPLLLATTIIALSAFFAVRSYIPDCCLCPSMLDPRNWLTLNQESDGCMSR